jgi:hypothetical protein
MNLIETDCAPHGTLQIQAPHLFKHAPNAQNLLPLNNEKKKKKINTNNFLTDLHFANFSSTKKQGS